MSSPQPSCFVEEYKTLFNTILLWHRLCHWWIYCQLSTAPAMGLSTHLRISPSFCLLMTFITSSARLILTIKHGENPHHLSKPQGKKLLPVLWEYSKSMPHRLRALCWTFSTAYIMLRALLHVLSSIAVMKTQNNQGNVGQRGGCYFWDVQVTLVVRIA